ncbi:MAG: carboxypeptidase-like regulatory domain-containing protein [Segetibacter sp.]
MMAEGFEQKNISITAGEDDIVQNFTLFTKEQELKTNFTITVVDPGGAPMANASVTLNDAPLAIDTTTSSFTGQIKANSNFTLNVSLAGFKTYTEAFTTTTDPKVINVKMIKLVSLKGSIVGPDGQPVINATVLLNGALTKTTNNIFEIKDLEGNTTYNLTIEAEGLEKYAETISPNNIDVDKVFTMATATKLTVKVGVFIPSDINFGVEPGQRISIRRGEINPGGGARVPDELAAGKSELLTNEGVSSKVDSVVQNYDDKLHLFSSDEKKANHTLIVEIKQLRLTLTAPLTVEDKDILVLIPAKQRYKSGRRIFLYYSNRL